MNENRKTFDHDVLWNEVRDRVLNRDLACVKEHLALYDDEKFENLRSHKSFELTIKAMVHCHGDSDSAPILGLCLEDFGTCLKRYLEDYNLNSLPTAEAMVITNAWCDIILDSIQQNTVD